MARSLTHSKNKRENTSQWDSLPLLCVSMPETDFWIYFTAVNDDNAYCAESIGDATKGKTA